MYNKYVNNILIYLKGGFMKLMKKNMELCYDIFSKIYDVVAIVDLDEENYQIIHSIDDGAYSLLPKKESLNFLNNSINKFIHKLDVESVKQFIDTKYIKEHFDNCDTEVSFKFRSLKNDGKYRICKILILPIVNDDNIKRYFYLSRTTREEVFDIKDRDRLTGVYKKNAFYEKINNTLNENKNEKFSLIRFDIDKFKMINDVYSEEFGDITLKYLGENIEKLIENKENYIAGRLGGDVFAILYPYSEENTKYIIDSIENIINDFEMSLFVCYGIYIIEDNDMLPSLICDRAHLAQKEVKGNSINKVNYYDEKLRAKYMDEAQISSCMHQALKDEAFQVYIQPKCSLEDGKPIGAEALVRWINPSEGMIPPYRFIPLFEKNNFIIKLDEYIWDKTCQIIKKLEKQLGVKIPISVNVSRNHIGNSEFAKNLFDLTQKYEVDPSLLHVEITESAFTQNQKELNDTIKQLRNYGFYVEIDDFGSGYSSLNILKDIEVDAIKLDMCFLRGDTLTDKAKSILESIVDMAKSLNLGIIPEGIEKEEHVEFLESIGCDIGQGYYFQKPASVDEFISYLNKCY